MSLFKTESKPDVWFALRKCAAMALSLPLAKNPPDIRLLNVVDTILFVPLSYLRDKDIFNLQVVNETFLYKTYGFDGICQTFFIL